MNSYLDDQAVYFDSIALAFYRSGASEKALKEYKRVTSLTTGRQNYGNIYAKSFYMIGKIYEEQGDIAQAMENYETFLELWKDSDPGIAEVEDAKVRLSGLRGQ
jgi:tetratricopeptide (TPR) repeat protein